MVKKIVSIVSLVSLSRHGHLVPLFTTKIQARAEQYFIVVEASALSVVRSGHISCRVVVWSHHLIDHIAISL